MNEKVRCEKDKATKGYIIYLYIKEYIDGYEWVYVWACVCVLKDGLMCVCLCVRYARVLLQFVPCIYVFKFN